MSHEGACGRWSGITLISLSLKILQPAAYALTSLIPFSESHLRSITTVRYLITTETDATPASAQACRFHHPMSLFRHKYIDILYRIISQHQINCHANESRLPRLDSRLSRNA
jgi:hypothetical protein